MKEKKMKQITSLILCMVLVFAGMQLPTVEVQATENNANETAMNVSSEDEFNAALANETIDIIQLTGDVSIAKTDDGKDNALVISREVTITGGQLTLARAGIVLGADVTFKDVSINFSNAVRNAIIANGHVLTLDGVTCNGTFNMDIFCGGITDYNGGNVIPEVGTNGGVIIKGSNSFTVNGANVIGGNIFAGSLSDVGYMDENNNILPDVPNEYTGDVSIIIEPSASGVGEIYACGGKENRTGGYPNEWFVDASLYKVDGDVTVDSSIRTSLTIHGATGTSGETTFIYRSDGTGYVSNPILYNVSNIELVAAENGAIADLSPVIGTTADFNTLKVPANTRLSFDDTHQLINVENLYGGGTLVLADTEFDDGTMQQLNIHNIVTGDSKIAIGGVDYTGEGSSGIVDIDRVCVVVDKNSDNVYSFTLLPNSATENIVLTNNGLGKWITEMGELPYKLETFTVSDYAVADENLNEISIPIEFLFDDDEAEDYLIMDIPMQVCFDGFVTQRSYAMGYEYAYSEYLLYFDYDENDNLSLVVSKDSDTPILGTFAIEIEIPGMYMADGQNEIVNFTLKAGNVSDEPIVSPSATLTTEPKAKSGLVYDGTEQPLLDAGSAENGVLVYSSSENGEYTEEIPTAQDAGDYTVWYYVKGDEGFSDTEKRSITVEIKKAALKLKDELTLKSNTLYEGEKLSKLEFDTAIVLSTTTGEIVNGTFAWEDADMAVLLDTKTATWVFTPLDTDSYNTLTGELEINVLKASDNSNEENTGDSDETKPGDGNQEDGKLEEGEPEDGKPEDSKPEDDKSEEAGNNKPNEGGNDKPNEDENNNLEAGGNNNPDDSESNKPEDDKLENDNKEENDKDNVDDTKDENEQIWEIVEDKIAVAEPGDAIEVNLSTTTTVLGEVVESIKGKDINIELNLNNGITWTINGKDVTSNDIANIDMGVIIGTIEQPITSIPNTLLDKVVNDNSHIELSLNHNGEFGFKATLSLKVDTLNAGKYANLYYYDVANNEMDYMCTSKVSEDGLINLLFDHASDYTIVITDDENYDDSLNDKEQSADEPNNNGNVNSESNSNGDANKDSISDNKVNNNEKSPKTEDGILSIYFIMPIALLSVFFVIMKSKSGKVN